MAILNIYRRWLYDSYPQTPQQIDIFYTVTQDGLSPSTGLSTFTYFTIDPVSPDFVNSFPTLQAGFDYIESNIGPSFLSTANTVNNIYYDYFVTEVESGVQVALDLKQDQANILDSISSLSLSSGQVIYSTGTSTVGSFTTSSYMRGLLNTASAAALKTALSISASDVSGLATVATSGAYSDLSGRPSLATVATSGAYADLTGTPSIPAAQVQSDWTAVTGLGVILHKPSLATVATTGAYSDLTGKPSLSTVATTGAYSDLSGKPSLATVATSGSYADLSSKPTINNITVYSGTTVKSAPILYTNSATVSSGVAVFNLTTDGTAGGTAIFPNGPIASTLNYFVNDATASYQVSGAWTNSNKTLTLTTNKLTTANILTGILGQASANSSVVNVSVWGN